MSGLIDHARIGRRLRRWLVLLGAMTVIGWLVGGLLGDGPTPAGFGAAIGVAVLLALLVEVLVVGGAAVAGALRAGERGDRLAAPDVTLLPPQVSGRFRRRRAPGAR